MYVEVGGNQTIVGVSVSVGGSSVFVGNKEEELIIKGRQAARLKNTISGAVIASRYLII